MFAIAFVCEEEERIMNCLVKNEDIGSNKSLPEFLRFAQVKTPSDQQERAKKNLGLMCREREQFQFVIRAVDYTKGHLKREIKDKAFEQYYARKKVLVAGSYVVL